MNLKEEDFSCGSALATGANPDAFYTDVLFHGALKAAAESKAAPERRRERSAKTKRKQDFVF